MVVLNQGINRIRDLLASDIGSGQAGTDSTTPTVIDTALVVAIGSKTDATVETSDKLITVTHTILSTQNNGSTHREHGTYVNSDATLWERIVHADIAKTSNEEITYIKTFFIDQVI